MNCQCGGPKNSQSKQCRGCQRKVSAKPCEWCGERMERKRMNGRLEDRRVFARRRFCSRACGNSRFNVTRSGLQQRARRMRGGCCESCGATTRLHVHHADSNPSNNSPDNLQTVCVTCHMKWHHLQWRRGVGIAGRVPTSGPSQSGFPVAWLDSVQSATPSSQRARTKSDAASSKSSAP